MVVRGIICILFCGLVIQLSAQNAYAPGVGEAGSEAIHKDSSIIISWTSDVTVQRGLQDVAQPNLGKTTVGSPAEAMGKADIRVVSLGDGGEAIAGFKLGIYNGPGPDFVIFENAFNDSFLELAFVEVSSDGVNYFRFPAHSLTDTINAVGSFGAIDPKDLNNFAGKYRGGYGTPFDLDELKNIPGLNLGKVTHIKIIDVVGSLDTLFGTRDHFGNKINEIYPTPFPSGGFDLDAVGAIHIHPTGIQEYHLKQVSFYPNPAKDFIRISDNWLNATYQIYNALGELKEERRVTNQRIDVSGYEKGIYFLKLISSTGQGQAKIVKE